MLVGVSRLAAEWMVRLKIATEFAPHFSQGLCLVAEHLLDCRAQREEKELVRRRGV